MLNMFPQLRPRRSTGLQLAMAANPALQQELLAGGGETTPLVDQYGYRAPLPWRDPRPPYESQRGIPPSPFEQPLGAGETAQAGGFGAEPDAGLLNALKGLAPDQPTSPFADRSKQFEKTGEGLSWIGDMLREQGLLSWEAPTPEEPKLAVPSDPRVLHDRDVGPSPPSNYDPTKIAGVTPTAAAAAAASESGGYKLPGTDIIVPTFNRGESPLPDWGEMPEAPVFAGPDYTRANEYFEAAKPKPYEEDEWDVKLAALAGLASGFSPEGTAGEILGRMAGPGMQAYVGARELEEEQALEADRAMQQWNASMGEQAGAQAGTAAEVANSNAQMQYDHALALRNDLMERMKYADARDMQAYEVALGQAELKLRMAAENRQAAYQQFQMENYVPEDTVGDAVLEGIKRGSLMDYDIPALKNEVRAELIAADPNLQLSNNLEDLVNQQLYYQFMTQLRGQ